MKKADVVEKIVHSDGTIEMTWPCGSKARIPQTAQVSREYLKDALLCDGGEQHGKDIDLAYKILDAKVVEGLINEEHSRLFSRLTDGLECPATQQGRHSKSLSDLRFAYEIREVKGQTNRRKLLREAISSELFVGEGALVKRIQRIEKQWQSLNHINPEMIGIFLHLCDDDDYFTNKSIRLFLTGLQGPVYKEYSPPRWIHVPMPTKSN